MEKLHDCLQQTKNCRKKLQKYMSMERKTEQRMEQSVRMNNIRNFKHIFRYYQQ